MWRRIFSWTPVLAAYALLACDLKHTDSQAPAPEASAAKPKDSLPAPFDRLRVGITKQELLEHFPPAEDLSKCEARLSGGDTPWPLGVSSKAERPRSTCVRSLQIAGFNKKEAALLAQLLAGDSDGARQRDSIEALTYIAAQIRGAARAGAVAADQVVRAAPEGTTWSDATVLVAGLLFDGAKAFVAPQSARRPICATVAADCDGLDPTMVRKYVGGTLSLDDLDTQARDRVADGKCRGPYVSREKSFQREFIRRAGVFTGIGLARSSRADRKLDPDKASSFSIYATRSKLKSAEARLGVLMVNALADTEAYWKGAIALDLGTHIDTPWSSAVVWLRGDKVQRVLLNLGGADDPAGARAALEKVWGPGQDVPPHAARWSLGESQAQLDWGPAMNLVFEPSSNVEATRGGAPE